MTITKDFNNKMPEQIKLEADIEEAGLRLDVFIANIIPDFSRSRVQQLIKSEESVFVNGKPLKNSYKLKCGDEILINVPEAKPLDLKSENISLDIRYEDENMLVVNKPAGMLTHPSSIEKEHTLVNALLYYCKDDLSGINGIMRPGIVHRLDRDTSGLLMIAKNDFAHKFLSEQLKPKTAQTADKTAKRYYLAVVQGVLKEDSGIIDLPIDRHLTQKHKMAVVEGGRPAVTRWKVIKRFKENSFVEVSLETGRTHQIRVHFSYINHPIVGDPLYKGKSSKINIKGQALQAYKLNFLKPGTKENIIIEIDIDDDIKKLLRIY